jgi:hypothetical protein
MEPARSGSIPQGSDGAAPGSGPAGSGGYLVRVLMLVSGMIAVFVAWGIHGRDHFAALPLRGDPNWYRDYNDMVTRELSDREVLYHGIGASIENARKADIILLGHSVFQFAIDNALVEEFERRHGIRIFNMYSAGNASGEFLRLIVKRWDIHPKLWIINADDYPANFFNDKLDDFAATGRGSVMSIVKEPRVVGYVRVAGRNVRWRIEDWLLEYLPRTVAKAFFGRMLTLSTNTWRSALNGNAYLDHAGFYITDHGPIVVVRDQQCDTNPGEIERARRYLADIGGEAILTITPYERWCPKRVRELASALGRETIIADDAAYSVWDGTHMDKKGAAAYTEFLLNALEKTRTFERIEHAAAGSEAADH